MHKNSSVKVRNKWLQLLIVGGLSPFFLFPSQERAWIFGITGALIIIKAFFVGKIIERTPIDWPVFILLHQVLLSCIITTDWNLSLPKIAGIAYAVIVYYVVVETLKSDEWIKKSIMVFLVGGLMLSIIGVVGMQPTDKMNHVPLLAGLDEKIPKVHLKLPGAEDGINPNALAGTIVLIFPTWIVGLIHFGKRENKKKHRKRKIFAGLFIMLILATGIVAVTASRGSWVAIMIAIGLIISVLVIEKNGYRKLLLSIVGALLLLGGLWGFLQPDLFKEISNGSASSYLGRDQAWSAGIDVVKSQPLTGIGMNHLRLHPGIGYQRSHALNHMIHTAAELGIPGLTAYLAILIGMAVLCHYVWKKNQDAFMKMAALGLGAGQFAHFVFGISNSIPLGAKPGIIFWISLALIVALYNRTLSVVSPAEYT